MCRVCVWGGGVGGCSLDVTNFSGFNIEISFEDRKLGLCKSFELNMQETYS